jgi:hypothetical protein
MHTEWLPRTSIFFFKQKVDSDLLSYKNAYPFIHNTVTWSAHAPSPAFAAILGDALEFRVSLHVPTHSGVSAVWSHGNNKRQVIIMLLWQQTNKLLSCYYGNKQTTSYYHVTMATNKRQVISMLLWQQTNDKLWACYHGSFERVVVLFTTTILKNK